MIIYNFGWLALPVGLFFLIKKYYLNSDELWLLCYANALLISTFLDSWIKQITHLIIVTAIVINVLCICKQTNLKINEYFQISNQNQSNDLRPKKNLKNNYNCFIRLSSHIGEQLNVAVYIISAWLLLRVYTQKSSEFGIGHEYEKGKTFLGLNESLDGWNCTQLQFCVIPFLWVIVNGLSFSIGTSIIKFQQSIKSSQDQISKKRSQQKEDNLYKQFVLKYKVIPDFLFSLIIALFNIYSYQKADTLFQCCQFWQNSYFMGLSLYYGYAFSTLYFFYIKKEKFFVYIEEQNSWKKEKIQRERHPFFIEKKGETIGSK